MVPSSIPPIVDVLAQVGDSIEHLKVKSSGRRASHVYVVIHSGDVETGNKAGATFAEITKKVQEALSSGISNQDKVKMLKGYKKIIERYNNKERGLFARVQQYFFGQKEDVIEAERLITKGLMENQLPEDFSGLVNVSVGGKRYEGRMEKGVFVEGAITDNDGAVYRGEFNAKEELQGEGSITRSEGRILTVLKGTFKEGKIEGKGQISHSGQLYYDGEFREGQICGKGTFYYPDQTISSDWFWEGETARTGAKIIDQKLGRVIEGKMENGILIGNVRVTESSGKIYEAPWVDGQFKGRGSIHHPDGSYYLGDFIEGKLQGEGKGRIIPPLGSETEAWVFEGLFVDNEVSGRGILHLPDGSRFEGEFKGRDKGVGRVIQSDGKIFEAEVRKGVLEKKGEILTSIPSNLEGYWKVITDDGREIEGNFKEGELNGKGEVKENTGVIFKGVYENGKLNGVGAVISPKGFIYEGELRDGVFQGKGRILNAETGKPWVEGEFDNGLEGGEGIRYNGDGTTDEVVFSGGKVIRKDMPKEAPPPVPPQSQIKRENVMPSYPPPPIPKESESVEGKGVRTDSPRSVVEDIE